VYKEQSDFDGDGTSVWWYYGVLDSFRLGEIELRNVPVAWDDSPNQTNDGLIGTWVFYHLLTTFDYAGRSLVLRRPTSEAARKVRADEQGALFRAGLTVHRGQSSGVTAGNGGCPVVDQPGCVDHRNHRRAAAALPGYVNDPVVHHLREPDLRRVGEFDKRPPPRCLFVMCIYPHTGDCRWGYSRLPVAERMDETL
jgi:hypothetical protein